MNKELFKIILLALYLLTIDITLGTAFTGLTFLTILFTYLLVKKV